MHFQVPKAKKQSFPLNSISLTKKYLLELIKNCGENQYHLIIRMEAFKPRKNDLLMTYIKFVDLNSPEQLELKGANTQRLESARVDFKIEVLRQKVEVDCYAYDLKDIYISDKLMSSNMPKIEDAKEEHLCLICFSELRNLVNLPCGHSCIGDACVKIYFENGDSRACPICRKGKVIN